MSDQAYDSREALRPGKAVSPDSARDALQHLDFHLENSPVIVTEWDKDFVLKYWSRQAELVFGWKPEEVVGKAPHEFGFIHDADRSAVDSIYTRMITGADPRNISVNRNYDKHGGVHYCEWYNSALLDQNGEVASIFAIALDVTGRIRAEQALKAREQGMRMAYQSAHLWFWEFDPLKYEVHYPDSTGTPFAGTGPVTVRAEDWFSRVHADDRQRVRDAVHACLYDGVVYDIEFRMQWPDGSFRWVYSRGDLFREARQPGRLLGVAMDITSRKHTEADLEITHERLRLAAEAAHLCAWDWDVRGDRFVWSGEFQSIYGHPVQRARSVDQLFDLLHPEDRETVRAEMLRQMASGETNHRLEYRVVWPDGSVHWILSYGRRVFDAAGQAVRALGISMDMTERKRSEDALRLTDRLVATGRMAAALAHEINNPLASVTNLLYLLEMQDLNYASREYVKMASAEIARVANITRNILGLYRESPTPIVVDVTELLDNTLALYRMALENKRIHVYRKYRNGGKVRGFPGELRQLFSNLIGNAIDAMSREDTLSIRVSRLGGDVRVSIADTGAGIAPENREKIYEPFFTTKGEKGTGLGLWICRQIVNKHNGSLRVHSRKSRGTMFSVLLPSVMAEAQKAGT